MVKAVLFDFGGVLVQTRSQEFRRKWELALGLDEGQLSRLVFDSKEAILATMGTLPESAIWEHIVEVLQLDDEKLEQLKVDFWKNDELDLTLVQYLKSLRPNYRTGILSNAWSNARRLFEESFHLSEAVDEIIISAEVGLAKPDVRIYQLAAYKLGVQPEEAVFVDDMPANVVGANQAGMRGIRYTGTPALLETLSHLLSI
jgi:epoxide hydrolase-like predicted phosphatase